MSVADHTWTIAAVEVNGPSSLRLTWSDGSVAHLDLTDLLTDQRFAALRDVMVFARVEIGAWGHSLDWPTGEELGADALWLETLCAIGRQDARAFLEWRLRHGLSLSKAADALGISRRAVAYYSNGERTVPKLILLACRGWEADAGLHQAA